MIRIEPAGLAGHGVRLEPLSAGHRDGLKAAASDGRLWELWYTWVPEPDQVDAYIATALEGQAAGRMLAWAVRETEGGTIVGSTRFHDIVAEIDRVEIGYTWYAASWQRTRRVCGCCARRPTAAPSTLSLPSPSSNRLTSGSGRASH